MAKPAPINKTMVKAALLEVEAAFQDCWATLELLKSPITPDTFASEMLEFQPKLLRGLISLQSVLRNLSHERRRLIKKKKNLNPDWFRSRLAKLSSYEAAVGQAMKIGRSLGDAFAWFFYESSHDLIWKHFAHPHINGVPGPLGANSELEFITRFKHINGHMVLHHGITNFLRYGDFSLVDLQAHQVVGLGELKSDWINKEEAWIEFRAIVVGAPTKKPKKQESAPRSNLHPKKSAQLKRQMEKIQKVLEKEPIGKTFELQVKAHSSKVAAAVRNATRNYAAVEKSGDCLTLIGVRAKGRSFANLLVSHGPPAPGLIDMEKLVACSPLDPAQVGAPDSHNSITLHHVEVDFIPGGKPLFWRHLPLKVLRQLYFHKVFVLTAFSPAHLARKLRDKGFTVTPGDRGSIKVMRSEGVKHIELCGFDYYRRMIETGAVSDDMIVELFCQAYENMKSYDGEDGAKVIVPMRTIFAL